MTRLTKIEKETIVLFNEGEDKANIYTHNAGLKKRLAAFTKKYPDLCLSPVRKVSETINFTEMCVTRFEQELCTQNFFFHSLG